MHITKKEDYALRALLHLAAYGTDTPVMMKEIADVKHIPQPFLAKIMQELSDVGLVESHRGVKGGFTLKKDPDDITFLDVIQAVDGVLTVNFCFDAQNRCEIIEDCEMLYVWGGVQRALTKELRNTSLASVLKYYQTPFSRHAKRLGQAS